MARKKPKTASTAAKPDKAEEVPTPKQIRSALFDLLDLANLCVTADQRVRTGLTAKELEVFHVVADKLKLVRKAEPAPEPVVGKTTSLTPPQAYLGMLRHAFNKYFADAARQPPTNARDLQLAALLSSETARAFPGMASPELVRRVMMETREKIRKGPPRLAEGDDWLIPDANWEAKGGQSKNKPMTASVTAGEVLRKIIEACPRRPKSAYSPQSTADYAARTKGLLAALKSRAITDNERLTFLATVLGAPVEEASWVGFLIRLAAQGRIDELRKPDWKDSSWSLREPTAFRRPSRSQWKAMFRDWCDRLEGTGRPWNSDTGEMAFLLAASHWRPLNPFDMGADPTTLEMHRPDDAWDPERTKRQNERASAMAARSFLPTLLASIFRGQDGELDGEPELLDLMVSPASVMLVNEPKLSEAQQAILRYHLDLVESIEGEGSGTPTVDVGRGEADP